MIKVTVNEGTPRQVSLESGLPCLNGKNLDWSILRTSKEGFSVMAEGSCIAARRLKGEGSPGEYRFRIRGQVYRVKVEDPLEQAAAATGQPRGGTRQMTEIRAPMPGLVRQILVETGSRVKAGDPLLVLEAMKMENLFKSPGDGLVKEIRIKEGAAVEKGAILLILE